MKKMLVLAVLATCLFLGTPNVLGMLGLGSYGLGISKDDPLGIPEKIHDRLIGSGFTGSLGQVGKPRTLKYVGVADTKLYPGTPGEIQISIGEEEYIQKIQGVYLNTQHVYSPQRNTPTGAFMSNLWGNFFEGKPKFERTVTGQIGMPPGMRFGGKALANISAMIAHAKAKDVRGDWSYSDDSMTEVMILSLAD